MQPLAKNWVTPEQIEKAREMDIITYLNRYEPGELVHIHGDVYCLKSHDSLKISGRTGKWKRWSTGDGGHTALDFLTDVRGMSFQEAVRFLSGTEYTPAPACGPQRANKSKAFIMPTPHTDNRRVIAYLTARGINYRLINYCISKGFLYEDAVRHNCVFVGVDSGGIPRNAMLRSSNSNSTFLREWDGSDKRFTFGIKTDIDAKAAYLFESCIDLLSYITLMDMRNQDWRGANYISLNGIYFSRDDPEQSKPPQALEQYLAEHLGTKELRLCLDNDFAGHKCVKLLQSLYAQQYAIIPDLPKEKDYNAQLVAEKGISRQIKTRGDIACER